jgi:hypothetical protein
MSGNRSTLPDFIATHRFGDKWAVEYTDPTHLPPDKYVGLGVVSFASTVPDTDVDYPILPFTFEPVTAEGLGTTLKSLDDGPKHAGRATKLIRDQLTESLVRVGMLRPVVRLLMDHEIITAFPEILSRLTKHRYVIAVVDTSAVRSGAVSYLHHVLQDVVIWTVVPVFLMTEVQNKVKSLNDKWRKIEDGDDKGKLQQCDVLRNRPSVSCIAAELRQLHAWSPVELLTTPPELLGQPNVDRLIIESVKHLKRERGLHHGVYLVTGDKDMASVASLENVNTLFVGDPTLPTRISSLRYDSRQGAVWMSPIHALLWDLAQVFSTIRFRCLTDGDDRRVELQYYCASRDGFIASDLMEVAGV